MSSVPAPHYERLPLPPRSEVAAPCPAATSLRILEPPALPTRRTRLKLALRNERARRRLGATSELAELGRATGARV